MSKLLLYCTKAKSTSTLYNVLGKFITTKYMGKDFKQDGRTHPELNGKIVAECDFEVDKLTNCGTSFMIMKYDDLQESYRYTNKVARGSCLDYTDLRRYLGTKDGYAIHIKNLHIFDYPKETGKFYTRYQKVVSDIICDSCTNFGFDCKKCPDNYEYENIGYIRHMMKVYGEAGNEEYIAIPVTSEEMCRIANGQQTVIIRKKVLKEML